MPTISELKDYVRRKLGDTIIQVELDDAQLQDVIEDTLIWFSGRRGIRSIERLELSFDRTEYPLPPYVLRVLQVYFFTRDILFKDEFGFTFGVPYLAAGMHPGTPIMFQPSRFSYSSLIQWLQHIETMRRVLGIELNWDYDEDRNVLCIYPLGQQSSPFCFYEYHVKLTEENFDAYMSRRPFEYDLVRKYAVACAKETLGHIRRKYGNIPTASGELSLDGDSLLSEAREEKEKLEEIMKELAIRDMGFLIG
jgi:hypothetical protein